MYWHEYKKIHKESLAKFGFLGGLLFGIPYAFLIPLTSRSLPWWLGVVALLLTAVLMAGAYYVSAGLYNLLARFVGGVKVLMDITPEEGSDVR